MHAEFNDIKFTDADVVNLDEAPWMIGCANNRPWLMHDHGFALAVVFAETLQDALDVAADSGKLDSFKVDYDAIPHNAGCSSRSQPAAECECARSTVDFLGNAGEPFDLENLEWVRLENVPFSFVALFNARKQEGQHAPSTDRR